MSFEKKTKTNKSAFGRKTPGFTLIEILVLLFVFSVIVLTFYSLFVLGTNYILDAKSRLGATALVNERMEIVRNLDYADIGTTTGIPHGDVLSYESVPKEGKTYFVFTFIQYVDDPLDGLAGADTNGIVNDYKRVRIKVAWQDDINSSKSVFLVANFVPKGIEKPDSGGTLAINIIDGLGNGIPQATVRIRNGAVGVDVTTHTNDSGNILLPGSPQSSQNYWITVTKDGYYPVQTFDPCPPNDFDPKQNVHASVTEGILNAKALITDKVSTISLSTEDPFGVAIPDVNFNLVGGWKKGETVPAGLPVYDYNQNLKTGGDGKKTIADMYYGLYTFTPTIATHEFLKLDAGASSKFALNLPADTILPVKAIFADKSLKSLLVTVKNNSDENLVEGASVKFTLKDPLPGLEYDVTVTTDKYGQAYFPVSLPELTAGDYDLKVTASGFSDSSDTVTIDSGLSQKEVRLTPS